ncbi:MAG TPA: histidine kinase [Chitinophaga sp.]|uniref:sensor histidine kinase n=1 Tax=Chitinophaga sp. TaxID=1869181 RepID=UPI002BEB0276|nr:histidine kinase [Chitinophaga sp.]HVI44061.1 histidine kinase [Chitinophaga sp.]
MNQVWYNRKWAIIVKHTAVWLIMFSLPHLLGPGADNRVPKMPAHEEHAWRMFNIVFYAALIAIFYSNALYFIPRFFRQRRYAEYTGALIGMFLLLFVLRYNFEKFFLPKPSIYLRPLTFVIFFIYLFIISISTAYQMIREQLMMERNLNARENENLKTELSLLRSQVSPHFMFNVLNNMVALARKKSDLLEPSLIKLSSLMRYMLYEADEEKVALHKEIEYLQSYIDLQQQRFFRNVTINVSFAVAENYYEIEPMLLIPFVENAFKHGTGMIMDAQIDINLSTKGRTLYFSVKNKYNNNNSEVKDKTSGIGLANVKRRLNLLYRDGHHLDIDKRDEWFTITLQLNLH